MPTATSLRQLSGSHPDQLTRDALLVAILNRLATRLEDWARDPQSVRAAYRSACVTLGRQVRVDLGAAGVTTATAVRIDDDGRLVVAENGVERALAAGDVTHVRMP